MKFRSRTERSRHVIDVAWADIEALLGRPHAGTPEDDRAIVQALLASDAPPWVSDASGEADEGYWMVRGPEVLLNAAPYRLFAIVNLETGVVELDEKTDTSGWSERVHQGLDLSLRIPTQCADFLYVDDAKRLEAHLAPTLAKWKGAERDFLEHHLGEAVFNWCDANRREVTS